MPSTRKKLRPGEILIRQGEQNPDRAYMVLAGRCEVFMDKNNTKKHIGYVTPFQIVGEIALIDNFARTASVVAVEPTEVEVMDRNDFKKCMQESNPFIVALLSVLSGRYRSLMRRISHEAD